ncbi:MAG: rRNA pseudouridine synthase [Lachnospiraceae bacterium]|nr:rRNA pseudouridine synthase [Lachnospiraceae bacterium]
MSRTGQETAAPQRLDKFLGRAGLGTRSELKKAIRGGRASVNSSVEKDPGRQVLAGDQVFFDGEPVGGDRFVYYLLHKPAGVITATEDARSRTVMDLLREPSGGTAPVLRKGLFPVGRLDLDTEGLLLITDDGPLAHRLLAPGKHVDKTYYAVVTGRVTDEEIRIFAEGMEIGRDGSAEACRVQPAELQVIDAREDQSLTRVTIREGKYHQIKRMFAAAGHRVVYLRRESMGPLSLDPDLAPGDFRALTAEEIGSLKNL